MFQQFSNNQACCNQLQISNTNRRLWMEHVLWTRFFLVSTAFNLPDISYVTNRLLQNPVDFARIMQPLYGRNAAMHFQKLFTEHLLIAAQLVNAAKAGNTAEADTQRKMWYENAREIACFLASINYYWSECKWREMLFSHLQMTEQEAVLIITGRYEESIMEYETIQAEALAMADVMTCGDLAICQCR